MLSLGNAIYEKINRHRKISDAGFDVQSKFVQAREKAKPWDLKVIKNKIYKENRESLLEKTGTKEKVFPKKKQKAKGRGEKNGLGKNPFEILWKR